MPDDDEQDQEDLNGVDNIDTQMDVSPMVKGRNNDLAG